MSIGEFRHSISFQSYTSVKDAFGGTVDTINTVLTTVAKVVPLRGSRSLSFAQIGLYDVSQFTVRWRENFSPDEKMKIQYRGNLYTIHEVKELAAQQRFWEITAYLKKEAI